MKYISFLLHVPSIHGELYNCKSDDASVAAIEYRSNLDNLALGAFGALGLLFWERRCPSVTFSPS